MDRSSMLNSYVADNEFNQKSLDAANNDLSALEFRIRGSKTVAEIKNEVDIFLERNNVPEEVKDNLLRICDNFSENTTVYQAMSYLEDFMSRHVSEKEKDFTKSDDTVSDIKEEVITDAMKSLDDIGITLVGADTTDMAEKIKDEDDVYKIKNNVERTTEHFNSQKDLSPNNDNQIEIDSNIIEEVIETPGDETLLESATSEQEDTTIEVETTDNSSKIEVLPDGTIIYSGDKNTDNSMNFVAMVTSALVVDNELDMNLSKMANESSTYRVAFGNFYPKQDGNHQHTIIAGEVKNLVSSYNPSTSYKDILMQKSPELMMSLNIVDEEVLGKTGLFQMNVDNKNGNYGFSFILDENYSDLTQAFSEGGAMVTNDAAENSVVMLNNTTPGDNLFALNITASSIHDLRQQIKNLQNVNAYQKQLKYDPKMNESALANPNFFMIVLIANLIMLTLGIVVTLFS